MPPEVTEITFEKRGPSMRILTISTLALLLWACGGSQEPAKDTKPVKKAADGDEKPADKPAPPKKMTMEETVACHAQCSKRWSGKDASLYKDCYTADSSVEMMDAGDPVAKGVEAIEASDKPYWDAFSFTSEVVLQLANGDDSLTMEHMVATNDGPMMGMKPTGKKVSMLVAELQNLDDKGRHGAVRVYMDMGTMMGQLGLSKNKVRPVTELQGEDADPVFAGGTEDEEDNVTTVRTGFDKFNAHDAKGLTAMYADNAILSAQDLPADLTGPKAIKGLIDGVFTGFPDAKFELGKIWPAGDYVVAEVTFTGTNKGPVAPFGIKKATKKAATMHELHVFQLSEGKIVEQWIMVNGMAMAMQLGLIPPPTK